MPSWTGNFRPSRMTGRPASAPSAGPGPSGSPKYCCMRITFLGHAGLFVETRHGSVLCDPWFTPGLFRVVVPVSPQRPARPGRVRPARLPLRLAPAPRPLRSRVPGPRTSTRAPGCCSRTSRRRSSSGSCAALGFTRLRAARTHGEPVDARRARGDDLRDDRARRRAARRLGARARRRRRRGCSNQNDARPGDPAPLQALGPFDAHFVQFSGAIWYPIVYDFPADETRPASRATSASNQMARARQYIEWVKAAHVFPCAGPPCFLDDDLFALNDLDDDAANIFPDQTVFLAELDAQRHRQRAPHRSRLRRSTSTATRARCAHPDADAEVAATVHATRRAYLDRVPRATGTAGSRPSTRAWSTEPRDLVAELAAWFEPLLERAPITSAGIAGNVVLDVGDATPICLDFVETQVRPWARRAVRLQGRRRPPARRRRWSTSTSRTG